MTKRSFELKENFFNIILKRNNENNFYIWINIKINDMV